MMHMKTDSVNAPLIWVDKNGIGHGAYFHRDTETLCGRLIKGYQEELRYRGRFDESTHEGAHLSCLWCVAAL